MPNSFWVVFIVFGFTSLPPLDSCATAERKSFYIVVSLMRKAVRFSLCIPINFLFSRVANVQNVSDSPSA